MKSFLPTKVFNTTSEYDLDKYLSQKDLDKYYNDVISHYDSDMQIAEANKQIKLENASEFNQIVELAKSFGYKVSDYVSGTRKRSGYYKDVKWVDELRKQLPSDSYYSARSNPAEMQKAYDSLKSAYEKRSQKLFRISREVEMKKEQEFTDKRKDAMAIRLAVKWGLDENILDRGLILEELINKDKYIMLAMAMEETRGDWSDGFYRVEYALGKFKVETQEDDLIYGDISGCMNCDDGRIFRDTDYNYSILYDRFANQELLADIFSIRGE